MRKWVGKTTKYDAEIRKFALTLHFYSPKGYNYVRRCWDKLLPHPGTLRKWCCSVNCAPGFSEEVLSFLKQKSEKPICNLVMDEMSIRQQLILKNGRVFGPVDLGFGQNEVDDELLDEYDEEQEQEEPVKSPPPLAKNALVFMLVSLKQKWKVPIGYFLIDCLNANDRANLLRKALELLHDSGVCVPSITFDGTPTNYGMAETLGACFKFGSSKFAPYIMHPSTQDKVFVFPDASHMVKNVRNVLGRTVQRKKKQKKKKRKKNCAADKKIPDSNVSSASTDTTVKRKADDRSDNEPLVKKIKLARAEDSEEYNVGKDDKSEWKVTLRDERNGEITFRHILNLSKLQDYIGLKIANKITDRHIRFWENVMNVRLAVQTLSQSTSAALMYLDETHDLFKDAKYTAKYCNVFNDAFDVSNVRDSWKIHGEFGRVVNEKNLPLLRGRAEEIINYIKNLKTAEGQPITQSRQKCGFIGFICVLTNIFELYSYLQRSHGFKYLLTYKLLQDHLENFFSCIRMKGGFNNNPNAHQFNVAYRRLIIHHELSASGNCTSDDAVPILKVSGNTFKVSKTDFDALETSLKQRFNFANVRIPSELVKDVVQYIGGCVILKLHKNPIIGECDTCKKLIEDSTRSCPLIDAKTKGYLKKPSLHLENLLLRIEGIIRSNELSIFHSKFVPQTTEEMLHEKREDYVGEDSHCTDHASIIVQLATLHYLKIRLHYEASLLTKIDKCIRRVYTKLITFQNQ